MYNLTYLSLEVDVRALQNQLPHAVYVASVGGDHEECGAVLHGGERDECYALTVQRSLEETTEMLASPRQGT